MPAALLCSVGFALILVLIGAPLAAALRGPGESFTAFASDALFCGLVVLLLVVTASVWAGVAGATVTGIGFVALATSVLVLRRHERVIPLRLRIGPWQIAVGAVILVAVIVRLRYVNPILWTGDMGGYVNSANGLVRTGVLESGFPPLFSVYLATGAKLFGIGHTGATTPLLGMMLIFGLLRIMGQLRIAPAVRFGAVALLGASNHAIWYSNFPASESLHAPLVLALVSLMITVLRARGPRLIAAVGLLACVASALALNRAQTVLTALPLLILLVCSLARSWTRFAWRIALAVAAGVTGVCVGYVYGVSRIRPYFLSQVTSQLPHTVERRMADVGLLRASPTLLVLMTVTVAAVLGFGYWASRRRPGPSRWAWPAPLLGVFLLATLAVSAYAWHSEVSRAVSRIGLWLPLAAAIVVVPGVVKGVNGVIAAFAVPTVSLFTALHAKRFPVAQVHVVYIYWDRYLFSEVVPLLFVLAAVGVSGLMARAHGVRVRRWAGPAVVAMSVLLCLPYARINHITTRHTMFSGAYPFESAVARLVSSPSAAVLWSATSPADLPHVFPNTYFSFGVPLTKSFGKNVINVSGRPPFGQDTVIGAPQIADALSCRQQVYIVDVTKPTGDDLATRAPSSAYTLTSQGKVSKTLPTIAQPEHGWVPVQIAAEVWLATRTSPVPAGSCP